MFYNNYIHIDTLTIMPLKKRKADLSKLPKIIQSDSTHVSLGDLHGNALKLIYVMIEEGVLELEDDAGEDGMSAAEKYEGLRAIYYKRVDELTKEDVAYFAAIIDNATVHNNKAVTLIGDELADRGKNDYFTLLVLQKLKKAQVNIDIMVSNHSVEFIRDYEATKFTGIARLQKGQGQSLANMSKLIERGIIYDRDVRKIVDECYKDMVKAIGYSISSEGEVTLFTHAPVGLETIKSLANKFGVAYKDNSPKELIHTIDAINAQVTDLFGRKQLAALIDQERGFNIPHPGLPVPPESYPLWRLIWNREIGDELITQPKGEFKVNFVHGHIGEGQVLQNGAFPIPSHKNLDSPFGKPGFEKTGPGAKHVTRHSSDLTAAELTEEKLTEISNRCLKAIAQEKLDRLEKKLKENQQQFNTLLKDLKSKTDTLLEKGANNPKYKEVAESASKLITALEKGEDTFFNNEITLETFNTFQTTCQKAITDAESTFVMHRSSWAEYSPTTKKILGILALFGLGIAALIVQLASKKGYYETFFDTPKPDSAEKLNIFEEKISNTVFNNMQSQLDIKTKLQQHRDGLEQDAPENEDPLSTAQ